VTAFATSSGSNPDAVVGVLLALFSASMTRGVTITGVAVSATIFVALLTAFSVTGCRLGVPVVDLGEAPPTVNGTISGRVVGFNDAARLVGRRVDATNVDTGARVSVTTASTGGFTLQVPPGTYRLSVELREGETLPNPPGPITINASDMDANIELVVSTAVSRPRQSDSLRGAEGLGAPVA
jgi:hypothetical protein